MRPSKVRSRVYVGLGMLTVVFGVIIFPVPGPMGVPTILFGLALIVTGHRRSAGRLRIARRTRPRLHALLHDIEARIPAGAVRDALGRTNRRAVAAELARKTTIRERLETLLRAVKAPFERR